MSESRSASRCSRRSNLEPLPLLRGHPELRRRHSFALDRHMEEKSMLWTIFVVLGILWLLGFSLHIGGGLIHLLLVVALVVLVFNLLSGRRSAV